MKTPDKLKLPYVYEDVDRHGNVRLYFWRGKGHKKVRFREKSGSAAFYQRYGELMHSKPGPRDDQGVLAPTFVRTAVAVSTFRWLCIKFFESPEFKRLDPRSQYTRRRILESCCEEPIAPNAKERFADFPLDRMTTDVLEILRDRKGEKLGAADNRVRALRRLFKWGKRKRHVRTNYAADLEYVSKDTGGWHSWTVDELERFEARHRAGTKA